MKISGRAYGTTATLEVAGDALTWRARRGEVRENVATTTHDVRAAHFAVRRISVAAAVTAAIGGAWLATESRLQGAVVIAVALVIAAYRIARPLRPLRLACGDHELVLEVDPASSADAAALVAQIAARGDAPDKPVALP